MKDVYVIKVDKICSYCGANNQISTVGYDAVDLIACGKCGEYIMAPDNITEEEEKQIGSIINQVIEGA